MVKQFYRFAGIGLINTIVQYSCFQLLLVFLAPSWAYSCSYGLAIIGSYLLNSRFTYHQAYSWQNFWRFTGVLLICQLGLSQLVYTGFAAIVGQWPTVVFVLTTSLMIPISFLCTRFIFLFKGK